MNKYKQRYEVTRHAFLLAVREGHHPIMIDKLRQEYEKASDKYQARLEYNERGFELKHDKSITENKRESSR